MTETGSGRKCRSLCPLCNIVLPYSKLINARCTPGDRIAGTEREPCTFVLYHGEFSLGSALAAIGGIGHAAPRRALRDPARDLGHPAPLPLVMLDPGHGGKDPGAIGVSGTYEKHVAFAAALELQRQLRAERRFRVELTRLRDVFVPLEERVGRAQRRGAALFVSMHADAVGDHTVRGASIYTLSETASDIQTAALAQRENSADRYAGTAFANQPPEVAHILASLVRQETRHGSIRLQHRLVGALDRELPMLQNPARHASFAVLRAADIPSVLVEMGFMSNAQDEAALRRPDHRATVAAAMRQAVGAFFDGPGLRVAG